MSKYELSNYDIEQINTLMHLGESIYSNLQILIDLEIKGLKQTQEYQNTIICLKSTLEFEEELYRRIPLDLNIITAYINYLNKSIQYITNINEQISPIIKENLTEMCINRIANRLYHRISLCSENEFNERAHIRCINNSSKKSYYLKFSDFINLNLAITKDFTNVLLGIINKETNKTDRKETYALLTKVKYFLAFLYSHIEEDLLNNNFEISNEIYLTSACIANHYKIDNSIYQTNINAHSANIVFPGVIGIARIVGDTNEELATRDFLGTITRCGLVFGEEKIFDSIKESTLKSINFNKTLNTDIEFNENFILNLLEDAKVDRELIRIVTLKLKREN